MTLTVSCVELLYISIPSDRGTTCSAQSILPLFAAGCFWTLETDLSGGKSISVTLAKKSSDNWGNIFEPDADTVHKSAEQPCNVDGHNFKWDRWEHLVGSHEASVFQEFTEGG